jgi:hypothetical protein
MMRNLLQNLLTVLIYTKVIDLLLTCKFKRRIKVFFYANIDLVAGERKKIRNSQSWR